MNWISNGHSILNWVWIGKSRIYHFICGHDTLTRSVNTGSLASDLRSRWLFCDFSQYKTVFLAFNSGVFRDFICENRKLPLLCLKHPLFQQFHKNPKWPAIRHGQMLKVAKHAWSSKVFLPLYTHAWKLLSVYILFLLSIYSLQQI